MCLRFPVLLVPAAPVLYFMSVGDVAPVLFVIVVVGAGGVVFGAVVIVGAAGYAGSCAAHGERGFVMFE